MDAIRQRKRRKKKALQVIKEAHKAAARAGMYALCLTLTYKSNAEFCRKHISAFFDKVRRWAKNQGFSLPYAWVLEQETSLHYHLIIWLPRGVRVDRAKLACWWNWGSTWIKSCRSVASWGSYITKFERPKRPMPKGVRLFGYGGLDVATKQKVARSGWPLWLVKLVPTGQPARRCKGGGWVNLSTGEIYASRYNWTPLGMLYRAAVGLAA